MLYVCEVTIEPVSPKDAPKLNNRGIIENVLLEHLRRKYQVDEFRLLRHSLRYASIEIEFEIETPSQINYPYSFVRSVDVSDVVLYHHKNEATLREVEVDCEIIFYDVRPVK